jgi:hypothetical protein
MSLCTRPLLPITNGSWMYVEHLNLTYGYELPVSDVSKPNKQIYLNCSATRYSPTLSLTSALDGGGCQCYAPAALPPGKTRYSLYRRLVGPTAGLDRSGQSHPTGNGSPDRPASSESLCRLSYPGPRAKQNGVITPQTIPVSTSLQKVQNPQILATLLFLITVLFIR